jgi:hypothetical protein
MSWPFSGRTQEMRTVEAAISGSDVSGAVISGSEGVGKSRLVREALSAAAAQGCQTRLTAGASSARQARAKSVIFQRDRGTEDGHPAVAVVLDRAAVSTRQRRRAFKQFGHHLAQALDVHGCRQSIECTTSANSTVTCL